MDNFVIGSDEFRFSFQKWAIVLLDKLIFCNFGVVNSLDFLLSIDLNGWKHDKATDLECNLWTRLYSKVKVTT